MSPRGLASFQKRLTLCPRVSWIICTRIPAYRNRGLRRGWKRPESIAPVGPGMPVLVPGFQWSGWSNSGIHLTYVHSCVDNLTCGEFSKAEAECLVRSLLETSYLKRDLTRHPAFELWSGDSHGYVLLLSKFLGMSSYLKTTVITVNKIRASQGRSTDVLHFCWKLPSPPQYVCKWSELWKGFYFGWFSFRNTSVRSGLVFGSVWICGHDQARNFWIGALFSGLFSPSVEGLAIFKNDPKSQNELRKLEDSRETVFTLQ